MKIKRRKRGAMLMMVAVLVLVIVLLGIAFFILSKMLGGGRELANSTDSGAINIAKHALTTPSKSALSFNNPDIATNFAVIIGRPDDLNLLNYNKLVAHAALVAFLARDINTQDSAHHAHKLWVALNEVGQYLQTNLTNRMTLEPFFREMADANNTKMLGKNRISLDKYAVSYMKRDSATNVEIDNEILESANLQNDLPTAVSAGGKKYMAGYKAISVLMPVSGETLTFVGVPVSPNDRTHLVDTPEFQTKADDKFVVGQGNPPYPSNTLPPNAFLSRGATQESHTKQFTGAVAAAIVGTLDRGSKLGFPYGYIEIRNGPKQPGPQGGLALQGKDIFCHALSGEGIYITGTQPRDFFCTGNETETTKSLEGVHAGMTDADLKRELDKANDAALFTSSEVDRVIRDSKDGVGNLTDGSGHWYPRLDREATQILKKNNYIDQWFIYNRIHSELIKALLWRLNIPDRSSSLKVIRHRDGSELNGPRALLRIDRNTERLIFWHDYKDVKTSSDPELQMLDAFKKGYQQYGTVDSGHVNGSGFTSLEQFKANALTQRTGCINCASIVAPPNKSGIKYFDHSKKYPSPANDWNFGQVKTPYDYLQMIDSVPESRSCALGSVIDRFVKRCQMIKPGTTRDQVLNLLKTQSLPLQTSLYMYAENGDWRLSTIPPRWSVPNTSADGVGSSSSLNCGAPYNVLGTLVNCSSEPPNGPVKKLPAEPAVDPGTDGQFPGWAWRHSPPATCTDSAVFVPSSGYNHLLGLLDFGNQCSGGGQFCEPN